jgi:hypothetical protein
MNLNEIKLWEKINNFQFDKPEAKLKFVDRLARENGWDIKYAHRVIDEYKKFIFLCCVSPVMVTPSDPVDQAWHLHLTYTRSYWVDLCKNTINREIHHNPTQGGKQEAVKYDDLYTRTRNLYKQYFYVEPPANIWQSNEVRFSDVDFERVNKKVNWIIKKPKFRKIFEVFGLLIAAFGSIMALDWVGIVAICIGTILLLIVIVAIVTNIGNKKNKGGGTSGSSNSNSSGCGGDTSTNWFLLGLFSGSNDSHNSSDSSGCSSSDSSSGGDSGCSSSGCSSGCGGGCGGGD